MHPATFTAEVWWVGNHGMHPATFTAEVWWVGNHGMHPAAFTWPRIQVSSTNIGQNIQIATTTSSGSKHCVWEGEESDALHTALLHAHLH